MQLAINEIKGMKSVTRDDIFFDEKTIILDFETDYENIERMIMEDTGCLLEFSVESKKHLIEFLISDENISDEWLRGIVNKEIDQRR